MNHLSNPPCKPTNHLLIVDDSPDNLFLLETLLQDSGYKISLAEDGYSALDEVKQSPPDLVLLDVMMPGMNGYEVTRRIRQNAKLPFIPILLITAGNGTQFSPELDTAAEALIHKPINVDELLTSIHLLLELKHSLSPASLP